MREKSRLAREEEEERKVQSDIINAKIQEDIQRKREHARLTDQRRKELEYDPGVDSDTDENQTDDDGLHASSHYEDFKLISFENMIEVGLEDEGDGSLGACQRVRYRLYAICMIFQANKRQLRLSYFAPLYWVLALEVVSEWACE